MNELTTRGVYSPRMSEGAIANIRMLEAVWLTCPQVEIPTRHLIHAGMYLRTIFIPGNVGITGVFITIPTALILCGKAIVFADGESIEIAGYTVIPASAGRKQAFVAVEDTYLTMMFPTSARTVEEAEDQFTDEPEILSSRKTGAENYVTITGE